MLFVQTITLAMNGEPWWAVTSSPPLREIVAECIGAKERANRRKDYIKQLKWALTRFLKGREDQDPRLISPADIEAFFLTCGFSARTRATFITRLGALFSWAEQRGYVQFNPVKRLDRITIDRKPPRILSPKEAEDLLQITRKHDPGMLPYIVVGLFAGVRPNEMDRLTWRDIDLNRAIITIDAAASKTRRRRIVPLHPKAVYWLWKCELGFPFAPNNKKKRLPRIAKRLGWDLWHHDLLRHSAASFLIALHKDAAKVSLMLGNSPAILLSRYMELVSDECCKLFWSIL